MAEKDDSDYAKFVSDLNIPEAQKRLEEKVTQPACPFCGTNDWRTESSPPDVLLGIASPTFVMKDPRSYFGPAPSIPTISVSCGNCGFIRQHNVSILTGRAK
ncbi:hypothetical protein [Pseudaminobacter sp. NGMCC 1.201702]|uniref:hypothetical protein n=1 Tax=Pseudaminobacter sp. NGMCC 1.201702 TaxID=3391825 RepID=UPI0039EEEC5B